jgi:hypothetical protein
LVSENLNKTVEGWEELCERKAEAKYELYGKSSTTYIG